MTWKKAIINGEEIDYSDDEEEDKTNVELKILSNEDYTPRIPRQLVNVFNKYPQLTKTLNFLYAYSYRSIRQNKYKSKDDKGIYHEIEIPLNDFKRWFGKNRIRKDKQKRNVMAWNENLDRIKAIAPYFVYRFTEDKIILDFKNNFGEGLNYIAELSSKEAKLKNNQLLFLKRIQYHSRIEQVFNVATLIKLRTIGDKNSRKAKFKMLKDLKLFQEMGIIKKVHYLNEGKQIKLRVWKEMKSGVGVRLKRDKNKGSSKTLKGENE